MEKEPTREILEDLIAAGKEAEKKLEGLNEPQSGDYGTKHDIKFIVISSGDRSVEFLWANRRWTEIPDR